MKSGIKTTEFWLATAATVCGILYASGVISPEGASGIEKGVAFIVSALASLGYSASRAKVKAAGHGGER